MVAAAEAAAAPPAPDRGGGPDPCRCPGQDPSFLVPFLLPRVAKMRNLDVYVYANRWSRTPGVSWKNLYTQGSPVNWGLGVLAAAPLPENSWASCGAFCLLCVISSNLADSDSFGVEVHLPLVCFL